MDGTSQLEIIGEIAVAILLGGIIGIEREVADKPAGFRSHMRFVAEAAALLVGLSDALVLRFAPGAGHDLIRSGPDPHC